MFASLLIQQTILMIKCTAQNLYNTDKTQNQFITNNVNSIKTVNKHRRFTRVPIFQTIVFQIELNKQNQIEMETAPD